MPFVASAALNNLQVDGVYVYSQPPAPIGGSQGVNTSLAGIVGSASWGPVNVPTPFGSTASLLQAFGQLKSSSVVSSLVREGWLGSSLVAALGGSINGLGVRVTDSTDVAAFVGLKDTGATNGVTLTAIYTGTEGNTISVLLSTGSNSTGGAPTMTATVQRGSYAPEVYPNLPNPTGGGFAAALISAINNGVAGVVPKSQTVVATVLGGASVLGFVALTTPTAFAGGTNGDATITTAIQVGTDGVTGRTGMCALRGSGVQQFILAGLSDATSFPTQQAFAASEGMIAIAALPSGTSTSAALTSKQTNNGTSQYLAVVKDWLYITDPITQSKSLVSPLGEALGLISSLPPEQSPGNKPVQGCPNILATERTGSPYSAPEAQQLETAGILCFTNPIPRGALFGFAHGENASAAVVGVNAVTDTIAYTRMTNYLGASIPALLGPYIGELQSTRANDPTRTNAKAALCRWLQGLKDANRIDRYLVTLDLSNNSATSIAQGYAVALVQVAYLNVIKFFLVTVQGGSLVQVGLGNVPQ